MSEQDSKPTGDGHLPASEDGPAGDTAKPASEADAVSDEDVARAPQSWPGKGPGSILPPG